MAKTGKSRKNIERSRYYLLHRECVRRNLEYIKQYQHVKKDKDKERRSFTEKLLLSDWGLVDSLPDPEERPSLSRLKNSKPSEETYLPIDFVLDPRTNGVHLSPLIFGMFDALEEHVSDSMKGLLFLVYVPEEQGYHTVSTIDTRWCKRDIEESLLQMAGWIVSERQKQGLKQGRKKNRLRVELGFEYLEVYDLRKSGKKFREIAEMLWGEDEVDIERKARLYYQKAKQIVDKPPIWQVLRERLQARHNKK